MTIGCSNIIPPMSFLDCEHPEAFWISTYFMGYEERRALKRGLADFTSVHLGQVDQWCYHTFHPDIAFFDVSLPRRERIYEFRGLRAAACTPSFWSARTTSSSKSTASPPMSPGERTLIHVSQAKHVVWADEEEGPPPAALWRPTKRPPSCPAISWTRSPTGPVCRSASAG